MPSGSSHRMGFFVMQFGIAPISVFGNGPVSRAMTASQAFPQTPHSGRLRKWGISFAGTRQGRRRRKVVGPPVTESHEARILQSRPAASTSQLSGSLRQTPTGTRGARSRPRAITLSAHSSPCAGGIELPAPTGSLKRHSVKLLRTDGWSSTSCWFRPNLGRRERRRDLVLR